MKCSAVRKDFWCLTNKVNQIIRTSSVCVCVCVWVVIRLIKAFPLYL